MANNAASPGVKITVGSEDVPDSNFQSYVVDRDMFQPDMAAVVLSNQGDIYSDTKIGDKLEIKAGENSDKQIFIGEVVGVEPMYKGGDKTKILIRAMNKLHRLLRVRKSVTFNEQKDQDIMQKVISDSGAGLSMEWDHDVTIQYKHVYQHNQTDLEFLRTRAARIGAHLWCVDTKVFVKKPKLDEAEIGELEVDQSSQQGALRSFTPRMSAASIVKKVTVKGWNPEKKELIKGEAQAQASALGQQKAADAAGELAGTETFTVDHPIWSTEEATVLAKARMQDMSLTFITGEAECSGDPKYELGKVVKITANKPGAAEDPFNGKYYIMGVTHRHLASKSKEGGYVTILKLARDMQKAG